MASKSSAAIKCPILGSIFLKIGRENGEYSEVINKDDKGVIIQNVQGNFEEKRNA